MEISEGNGYLCPLRAAAVAWSKQVVGNVEQGEAPTPFRVGLETRLNDISDQK